MFSVKELKDLYTFFEDAHVGEIEFQRGDLKVRMVNGVTRSVPVPSVVASDPDLSIQPVAEEQVTATDLVKEVTSKWVGVFTRLNPKTKEAYVKLRDVVSKGDVVAHIRVLGHLQDVLVEEDGKIKEILIEEGQPVEYGQPLFRLEA